MNVTRFDACRLWRVRAGHYLLVTLAAIWFSTAAFAGDWPGWRGPSCVGWTDETELPLEWDGKTGDGVLWKASLKGTSGHSSPIVWGDRVFLTTSDKQTHEQEHNKEVPDHHIDCYKASDGTLLWSTRIAPGSEVAGHSIYASPTPATDGKAVYAWFGSAVIAAVDFDGKLLWRHERKGPFVLNPGICSSPILYKDTVVLLCDQGRNQGFIQGINKSDGEIKWEQSRKGLDYCNGTPILMEVSGKKQLIVAGSKALYGLEPASGEPIWWCTSRGFGSSPAYGHGLVYADRGGNEPAVCVDPTGQGDVTKTHVKWQLDKSPGDYASPVISGDYIYRPVNDGVIECRSLANGERLYNSRLEGVSKLSSPIATADGRIYFVSTGHSYVLKAGPTLEILSSSKLPGGGNGSSPAVSGGRIFVRDHDNLYCVGK
jgi:outer membrane protein assembly factor BamB